MRQHTLRKEQYNAFPNCVNEDSSMAGRWAAFFGNDNPIVLEIGCGKADLSYGQALLYPGKNLLGVDIKAVRMWAVAQRALEEHVTNLGFLRCDIHGIRQYFAPGEVSEIWITFPDPFPRKKHAKNRLTHERFLRQYRDILKPGGALHFKTDNEPLFDWTLEHFQELREAGEIRPEVLGHTRDLHSSDLRTPANVILTDFERRFQAEGLTTKYMEFRLG